MSDVPIPPPRASRKHPRMRGLHRLCARLPQAAVLWSGGRSRHIDAEGRRDTPEAVLPWFFDRAPVGLVQAGLDRRVELLNPVAADCLLPFSPDGVLCEGRLIRQGQARPVWLTVTKQAGMRWMAESNEPPLPEPAAAAAPVAQARVHGPLA